MNNANIKDQIKIYTQGEVLRMTDTQKKAAKVSPHFSVWELECKCGCGYAQPTIRQMVAMEKLRAHIGKPIQTRWAGGGSACRCVTHNMDIGGAVKSKHIGGEACDTRVKGMTPHEVAVAALAIEEFKEGGIIIYDTFTHLDCGTGNNRPLFQDKRKRRA